ncbi:hypothetical protein HMPREF9695_01227 [Afipia broomeae ATCC 49717]|uniref:Uncharacterized protein n=1 Tax=Afipia broomeae ATCC 49717 TaxID=883078 RepID=K8PRI2_9BRAD|nr:hypothetical protein HMPREF9695_01227 [Afipia broomeae ATCC 49717]
MRQPHRLPISIIACRSLPQHSSCTSTILFLQFLLMERGVRLADARRLAGPGARIVSNPLLNKLVNVAKAMCSRSGKHSLHYAVAEDEGMNKGRADVDADGDEQSPSGCLMPTTDQASGG